MQFSRSSGAEGVAPWNRAAVRAAVAAALLLAGLAAAGCRGQSADDRSSAYRPFYAPAAATDARGTLKGDYQWAAASPTRDEALARWKQFLQKHRPPDGEYQDAFQRNYVKAAQYELMRLEYLAGHANEGDALLRELEDIRNRQ